MLTYYKAEEPKIKGYYVIDSRLYEGKAYFLFESEKYGDEAPSLVIDQEGAIIGETWYTLEEALKLLYEYE